MSKYKPMPIAVALRQRRKQLRLSQAVVAEKADGRDDMGGPDGLKDFAGEIICQSAPEGLARDYALAFLSEVNWYEIANALRDEDEEAA